MAARDPRKTMPEATDAARDPERPAFHDAWVGLEPTFQSAKSVRKWATMSVDRKGEDAYFACNYMVNTMRRVARRIVRRYRSLQRKDDPACLFAEVERHADRDPHGFERQDLVFHWSDAREPPLEMALGLDPETFEFNMKPVPLEWFYEPRFVDFLEALIWTVPQDAGLAPHMGHGGGQFSLSAKTFLRGSLLADDIAWKLNHPELATWIMDYPNGDDRAFRATEPRFAAFRRVLAQYWEGRFHPRAIGTLTTGNAYLDRGFGPAVQPVPGLMTARTGPVGSVREVFQTNFAFGRTVRLSAQNVHPGYWQSVHPDDDDYRPDQIMRYSEGNLNRLQIAGELHVKSGDVVERERAPEFDAPLDPSMLATEATWENRAQMTRTSARDHVEAMLLDVHHAHYLARHPHVPVRDSLEQDQLLGGAERTLERRAGRSMLARLHRRARAINLEASRGRIRSDWIEPETLFWAAWHVLPARDRAAIAREAITGFIEYVAHAAQMDRRPGARRDPMERHRHRIHPLLWEALSSPRARGRAPDPVEREYRAWRARREEYLARRPAWSPLARPGPP